MAKDSTESSGIVSTNAVSKKLRPHGIIFNTALFQKPKRGISFQALRWDILDIVRVLKIKLV